MPYEDGLVWLAIRGREAHLAVTTAPGIHELLAVSLASGARRTVARLADGGLRYPSYSFSADGARGVVFGLEELPAIWLIRGALR